MIGAVGGGSGYFPPAGGGGGSSAALQAELQRYQRQLAACVDCASANTPEGRKEIQDLSAKIGDIKSRIDAVPSGAAAPVSGSGAATAAAPGAGAGGTPFRGGLIDLYA